MATVIDWLGGSTVVMGFGTVIFIAVLVVTIRSRRVRRGNRAAAHKEHPDEEKRAMGSRVVELESANSELRERLRNLEMEYLQRQDLIKNSEIEVERKKKELDEGLKEVYALKELIEDYRLKLARLNKEKVSLEIKVGELTASLKEGKKRFEKERDEEIKRLEDERDVIKREAKEMVLSYKKETENRINSLEEENKDLKERLAKLKEQYSAWEAIEGL